MQAIIQLFIVLVIGGVVAGCASQPEVVGHGTPTEHIKTAQPETDQYVEDLSAGKSVTVKTSQGEIGVEPNVVAVTDAQTNPDIQVDKFYYDPLEDLNRSVFGFNHYLYKFVLIPASSGYQYIIPGVVRSKIGNAFGNIREPLNLLNNLIAGEVDEAGANLGRFLINSSVGILGFFDPAAEWFDISAQKQTISDTLQRYDVSPGPYLVLPVLGPNDTLGAISIITEGIIHPIKYIFEPPETYQLFTVRGFDDFSNKSENYQLLYEQAEDPYIYFRNQFIQGQRRDELFQYHSEQQDDKN